MLVIMRLCFVGFQLVLLYLVKFLFLVALKIQRRLGDEVGFFER